MLPSIRIVKGVGFVIISAVPRKNPIPPKDSEVASRIKAVRSSWKLSRSFIAARCATNSGEIARIELGRVPLKYGIAKQLLRYFDLNPVWLMTGKGEQGKYIPLPDSEVLGASDNDAFTEVFTKHLHSLLTSNPKEEVESPSSAYTRYVTAVVRSTDVHRWFCDVPDGYVQKLDEIIKASVSHFFEKWPADSWERLLERRTMFNAMEKLSSDVDESLKSQQLATKNKQLYNVPIRDNNEAVKARLPTLIKRLNEATTERGTKTALAKFMDVPLSKVSQWLSGAHEPGGETTLQLLHWVEQQERQK